MKSKGLSEILTPGEEGKNQNRRHKHYTNPEIKLSFTNEKQRFVGNLSFN